ncbi:decaprenyl-phosphate phosphoribosyltransferase [Aeromicrobium sp. S22]|uniref:decaprenyl-phosphate phosphoribosyltransferase n=1 Tax=Aeromicrobium sp. S22 TaxID=2662029 RepID=UPI00129E2E15|nr:decaprenyl-phosphate phosphoribosyltransferase [Aeromicrobium sp. S22]MRK02105.1 decaprenyl-phosphate phosphoribosyltransferase [Aeromicrobium sp. S22]
MNTPARTASAVIRTMRPRQWTKNTLVLAAPLAAGLTWTTGIVLDVVATFVAFTLAAAGIYLLNDVIDAEDDRRHPTKRNRPVASGELSSTLALACSGVCAALGIGIGYAVAPQLAATLILYALLQIAYAVGLKRQPVIDLSIVAAGFLLRAIAGGVAVDVPLSQWFLLVAAFGSLFMVAGKRYSELRSLGSAAGTRKTLETYSESYLRFVWSLAAAVTITAYSLWAFEISSHAEINWQAISIAPFVVGLLRYAVDVDRGLAGEPEEAVLRDPALQVLGAVWLIIFATGVYAS